MFECLIVFWSETQVARPSSMSFLVFASLISASVAVPPIWWNGGQCGVSKYTDAASKIFAGPGKIVGGQYARLHEFPWQVSLKQKRNDIHFCGGSIINERWIVTAAHCLEGRNPSEISVVVGEHKEYAVNSFRRKHDIELFHLHNKYNNKTLENDIAVIKTNCNIHLNENVKPICAPDPDKQYANQKSQVSGWGDQSYGGENSDILKYVTLNITTNEFCQNAYTCLVEKITDDMICTTDSNGVKGRGPCQGDSGGPLSVKDAKNIFSLVGVVSWGQLCASCFPAVYARVGVQTDWITYMIANN